MKKKQRTGYVITRTILIIIAIAIYCFSGWLLLGPYIKIETQELASRNTASEFVDATRWSRQQFEKYKEDIAWYNEYLYMKQQTTPTDPPASDSPVNPGPIDQENAITALDIRKEIQEQIPYGDLFLEMTDYNHTIFENNQKDFNSIASYSAQCLDVKKYGINDDVVGSVYFPGLDVSFPLYLGASMDHLNKGVAQLSQTSMPIGGPNTNCVIAGHRGWHNGKYLKDIEKIHVGDTIVATTLWDVLHYDVKEIKIIKPNDIDAIKIQPGKDLLTIVTCHPYGSGGRYRYLLICERNEQEHITPVINTDPVETVLETDPVTGETITVVSTESHQSEHQNPNDKPSSGIHIDSEDVDFESSQMTIFWDDTLHYIGFAVLLLLPISLLLIHRHQKKKHQKELARKHSPKLTRRQ